MIESEIESEIDQPKPSDGTLASVIGAAANDSTHLRGNSRRFRTTPCDLDVSLSLQGGTGAMGSSDEMFHVPVAGSRIASDVAIATRNPERFRTNFRVA